MGTFYIPNYKNCYAKVFSPKGYDLERTASHEISRNEVFKLGGYEIPIVKRTRKYDSAISLKLTGKGDSWESWLVNKHGNNFTDGQWAENYAGHISDDFEEVRGTLYYVDLKNDIAAWKETTTTVAVRSGGIDLPWLRPQGGNLVPDTKYWHFLKFPNTNFTKTITVKEYIRHGSTVYAVATAPAIISAWTENMVLDFTFGYMPDIAHLESELGNYYQWEPYFLKGEENETPDGFDFFNPSWLPKDAFDAINNYSFFQHYSGWTPINGTFPLSDIPNIIVTATASESTPRGSWAVDSFGNFFASQVTVNGTVFNHLDNGDPVDLCKLNGANPVFFPIAPV